MEIQTPSPRRPSLNISGLFSRVHSRPACRRLGDRQGNERQRNGKNHGFEFIPLPFIPLPILLPGKVFHCLQNGEEPKFISDVPAITPLAYGTTQKSPKFRIIPHNSTSFRIYPQGGGGYQMANFIQPYAALRRAVSEYVGICRNNFNFFPGSTRALACSDWRPRQSAMLNPTIQKSPNPASFRPLPLGKGWRGVRVRLASGDCSYYVVSN